LGPLIPDLSVIIVSWNVAEKLAACLGSLRPALKGLNGEVFVVDNASQDGSAAMVRTRFPEVKLIENAENAGYAAANNQAIQQARGRFVLLLNPDTIVPEPALAPLLEAMNSDPTIGIASPVLTYPDGTLQSSSSMRYPGARRDIKSAIRNSKSEIREVAWVLGAAMLIRREVLEKVGLLDTTFYLYGEDADICKRARDAGWRIVVMENSRIVHEAASSSQQLQDEQNSRMHFIAELQFLRKHYPRVAVRGMLFKRLMKSLWCLCWYGTVGRFVSRDSALKFRRYREQLRVLLGRVRKANDG
jgi:GT2 family glycosyltransferase